MALIASSLCPECEISWHTQRCSDETWVFCKKCKDTLVSGPKTWDEADVKKRIEVLREKVGASQNQVDQLKGQLRKRVKIDSTPFKTVRKVLIRLGLLVVETEPDIDLPLAGVLRRKIETLTPSLKENQQELARLVAILLRKIPAAQKRYRHKQLMREQKFKAVREHRERERKSRKKAFNSATQEIAQDRHSLLIQNKDYKRGNALENYIRSKWRTQIYNAFSHKCVSCGSEEDLTLDHFWLPKNEGGNFAMFHKESKSLVSNVVVLCRSCNSAKGETRFDQFFPGDKLIEIHEIQILLSKQMMKDVNLCKVARRWYGEQVIPLFQSTRVTPPSQEYQGDDVMTTAKGQKQQLDFWVAFSGFMAEKSQLGCSKPAPRSCMSHPLGISGFHLSSVFSSWDSSTTTSGGELRVELVIDGANRKTCFELLQAQQEQLHKDIGGSLTWSSLDVRVYRIYVQKSVDIDNRDNWSEYREWLKEKLERFHEVFLPRIKELSLQGSPRF